MEDLFRLLKLKRERRLPPFIGRVNPPGYRKRNGSRALWTVLRKDQYRVDGDRIVLQGLGAISWIEAGCKGPIHLRGERGELRIRYDADGGEVVRQHSLRGLREGCEGRMEAGAAAAER